MAKESVLKAETFKEVSKTKEAQLVKDHEAFDKQIASQMKEIENLRQDLQNEHKRREELTALHHSEIQKIQTQRE